MMERGSNSDHLFISQNLQKYHLFMDTVEMVEMKTGQKDVRPGFLEGNSIFWPETTSVNIVSTASYKTNHNGAIRKQMWFTFLTATD